LASATTSQKAAKTMRAITVVLCVFCFVRGKEVGWLVDSLQAVNLPEARKRLGLRKGTTRNLIAWQVGMRHATTTVGWEGAQGTLHGGM
jgi:hypothetical protein